MIFMRILDTLVQSGGGCPLPSGYEPDVVWYQDLSKNDEKSNVYLAWSYKIPVFIDPRHQLIVEIIVFGVVVNSHVKQSNLCQVLPVMLIHVSFTIKLQCDTNCSCQNIICTFIFAAESLTNWLFTRLAIFETKSFPNPSSTSEQDDSAPMSMLKLHDALMPNSYY